MLSNLLMITLLMIPLKIKKIKKIPIPISIWKISTPCIPWDHTDKNRLLKLLKDSFKKDNINEAFDLKLKAFLYDIDPTEVPDNLTSFYYTNIQIEKNPVKKIKFNNDIMHQSKLINYFNGDYAKSKIKKDVENFLKKIKKNKKYFLSKKDIIFLESLKNEFSFLCK